MTMHEINFKKYGIESIAHICGNCEEKYYETPNLPLLIVIPEMHGHLKTIYKNAENAKSILNMGAADCVALEGVQWPNGLNLNEFVTFSVDNEYVEKYVINRLFELILFRDLYGLKLTQVSKQAEWSLSQDCIHKVIFQSVDNADLHSNADEWGNKNSENLYNGLIHDIEAKIKENEDKERITSFIVDEFNSFHRTFMNEIGYDRDLEILTNIQRMRQKNGLSKATILNIGSDHVDHIVKRCGENSSFNVVLVTHKNHSQLVQNYDYALASMLYEMVSNKEKHWNLRIKHLRSKKPNPFFYVSKVLTDYWLQVKDCEEFCENISFSTIDHNDRNIQIIFSSILKIKIIAYSLTGRQMTEISCMDDLKDFIKGLPDFLFDSDRMGICCEIPPIHRALYELSYY